MNYFQQARQSGYAVGAFIADALDTMEATPAPKPGSPPL